MTNKRAAAEFIEKCNGAGSADEVRALLFREAAALGFPHVACCSHVLDPLNPPLGAVSMINYPDIWADHFSHNCYARRDPVFFRAIRQITPFHWNDRAFREGLAPDQLRILEEAAELGLKDGFTIPIPAIDALPASCSFVPGPDGADPADYPQAHWMGLYAHEAARRLLLAVHPSPVPSLSPRERECLEFVGRGKEEWTISQLLNITPGAVHKTLQRGKKRYGVATRTQALMRALLYRQISLADVVD